MKPEKLSPELAAALGSPDDATLPPGLASRLRQRAQERELVDLAYDVIDSPVGPLLLAAADTGLVRLAFVGEGHDMVLEELAGSVSPRILRLPASLRAARVQIEEYFDRRRRRFDIPVDLRLSKGFRRVVLEHLMHVDYGKTVSYSALAAAAGNPTAVRAAASACATNPLPLVIPCHRIVRSDGSIGRYGGGVDAKQLLLTIESG